MSSEARVSASGVSLGVPVDWQGRVSTRRLESGGPELAHLWVEHLEERGQFAQRLRDGEVVITLSELGREEIRKSPPRLQGRLRISPGDFLDAASPQVPLDHSVAKRSFTTRDRSFDLEITFGDERPESGLIAGVNRVLASLTVERER